MSSNIKRFILLGESGAGKSSFVNSFYNYCYGTRNSDDVFGEDQTGVRLAIPCRYWLDRVQGDEKSSERDIDDQTQSQTANCTSYQLRFDSGTIELIDTPGFNDSEGVSKDDTALRQIELMLQSIPFLSGIIVVANGSVARLGTSFSHFMRLLHEVWPNSLMQNVCAVLTNCDDTSYSLSSDILHADLKVNETTTFYLQNSLFRWDRTTRTSKIIRNFRRDFEDATSTLDTLLLTLARFDTISTDTFRLGELKQRRIQKCIVTSIGQIINLLRVNRLQRVVAGGLTGAKTTMAANTNWEKQESITAFKWMEVEPSRPPHGSPSINRNDSIFHTENSYMTSSSDGYDTAQSHVPKNIKHDTSLTKINGNKHHSRNVASIVHSNDNLNMKKKVPFVSVRLTEYQPIRSLERHNSVDKSIFNSDLKTSLKNSTTHYGDNHHHQTEPIVPREYRRQNLTLQVTLHDNEAKSHHETARHQAEFLRDKAVEFADKHDELIASMNSLLDELEDNVRDIRQINAAIDLLDRNMDLIEDLRNEISLAGDEPKMVAFFQKVLRIVTKPTTK